MAVLIIVILAFMGVMFVSLLNTSIFTATNDLQSTQALAIANAGVEYEQMNLAQNIKWYRGPDPVYTTTLSLGSGSFTATTNVPATMLQRRLQTGDTIATVYSTNRFPQSGYLQIDDDIGSGAEFVQYSGIAGNTFTGLTRGVTIGTVASTAGIHPRTGNVYPVAKLQVALASNCASTASITLTYHSKFLSAGTISILGEEINYTGVTVSGTNMILSGIQRCQNSTSSVAANVGDPVTPLLAYGSYPINQAEVISTGTVGGAVRVIGKTIQR